MEPSGDVQMTEAGVASPGPVPTPPDADTEGGNGGQSTAGARSSGQAAQGSVARASESAAVWATLTEADLIQWSDIKSDKKGVLKLVRMIDPNALNSEGVTFHSTGKTVCCKVCLAKGTVDPTLAWKKVAGFANLERHVERQHPAELKAANAEAAEEAAQEQVAKKARPATNPLGFTAAPKPDVVLRRALLPFTAQQCTRVCVAALVLSQRAVNMIADPMFRFFLQLVSGGTYLPPSCETVEKVEVVFAKECKSNIHAKLRAAGITSAGGAPKPSVAPLVSLTFDTSSTLINGYKSIGLNVDWLDPVTFEPVHACLGVTRLKLEKGDEAVAANAEKLGQFVVEKLKEFNIVPHEHLSSAVYDFVRAASTDNGSAEVKCVRDELRVPHQPCVCHTLELVVGSGLDPNFTDETKKAHSDAVKAARAAGTEPPPPPPRPRLAVLVDILAAMAKWAKKGKGQGEFASEQRRAGVSEPRALISRAKTRWSMSLRLLVRAVQLRKFMPYMSEISEKGEFTADDWVVMVQSIAFLAVFQRAITALQSRTMLIGEHVAHVYQLAESIAEPEMNIRMLPHDVEPTAVDLNDRKFKLESLATVVPRTGAVAAETEKLRGRLHAAIQYRLGRNGDLKKVQLNSDVTADALVFDPGLKMLILEDPNLDNAMFNKVQKLEAVARTINVGKKLEQEMFGASDQTEAESPEESAEQHDDVRGSLMQRLMRRQHAAAAAAATGSGALRSAPRELRDADSRFVKEFNAWKAMPPQDVKMSVFWASEVAAVQFPIMRRLFRSRCSTRPHSAEVERNFSALMILLTPLRRGRLKARSIERKLFLVLNKQHWKPLPDVPDGDVYFQQFAQAAGLIPTPGKPADEAVHSGPLCAGQYMDSEEDDSEDEDGVS